MSNFPGDINLSSISDVAEASLIVKSMSIEEKPKVAKFKGSSSENNLKPNKGIKQKIVSRVKSWSNKEKYTTNENIEVDHGECSKSATRESDPNEDLIESNLARARGSLENLLRDEQNTPTSDLRARSCSSTPKSKEKGCPESPKSSPVLNDASRQSTNCLFWDPFDKKGRKNRKDAGKKKKKGKNVEPPQKEDRCSMPLEGKPGLIRKEGKDKEPETQDESEALEEEGSYKYKYFPKNSKSVVFTNEVFVVYFNGEEVLYEAKEPLKKDVDQQLRNKEMRQGHLLKTQEKYNLCLY